MTNVQKLTVRASEIRARLVGDRGDPGVDRRTPGRADHPSHRVPGHRGQGSRRQSRPKVTPNRSRWGRVAAPKIAPTATCAAEGEHRGDLPSADRTAGDRGGRGGIAGAPRPASDATSRLTCCARLLSIGRSRRRRRTRRPCRKTPIQPVFATGSLAYLGVDMPSPSQLAMRSTRS